VETLPGSLHGGASGLVSGLKSNGFPLTERMTGNFNRRNSATSASMAHGHLGEPFD